MGQEEIRRLIVRVGTQRFGPPDSLTLAKLTEIDDLHRLETLPEEIITAPNWQMLFADENPPNFN